MKIFFFIVIVMHGLLHLVGFIKSFNLIELSELTNPIPRFQGVLWLITSLMLFICLYGLWYDYHWWWMMAIPAVVISQTLIILDWNEASIGTVANIIVLVAILFGYAQWNFTNIVEREVRTITTDKPDIQHQADTVAINNLPKPVAQWLERSGAAQRNIPRVAVAEQKGKLRTSKDGKWMEITAKQWINPYEPGFVWKAWVSAGPGIHLSGMDKYYEGKGRMWIQLLSLISVVDEEGPETDQGSALRFLGEIAWIPGAAVLPFIHWEEIDSTSARANFSYGDVETSGVFHFDEKGDLSGFEALRYFKEGDEFSLKNWIIEAEQGKFLEFDGFRIPSHFKVSWDLQDGRFTWLEMNLTKLTYQY